MRWRRSACCICLAEPNLTAVSGETAKFLAGGEFPVPRAATSRAMSPSISSSSASACPSRRWCCRPAASACRSPPKSANSPTPAPSPWSGRQWRRHGARLTIPALNVRRAETTVELPSGGSFAIAGLMQHTTKQQIDGFPGVKDLPVLGALFRSRDFQNDETELVVMVTAYLVNPTTEAQLAVAQRRLYHADRSGDASAGHAEHGLQEKRQAADAGGRGPGRLCGALGETSCARRPRICSADFAFAAVLMAGSCTAPFTKATPTISTIRAVNHPITVEPSYQSLKLSYSAGGSGSRGRQAKLDAFVTDYRTHGNGKIAISVPGGAGMQQAVIGSADRINDMGVCRDRILVASHDGRGDRRSKSIISVIRPIPPLAATGRKIWLTPPTITTAANFGCSMQHNIAAMVADPRDLIGPRPMEAATPRAARPSSPTTRPARSRAPTNRRTKKSAHHRMWAIDRNRIWQRTKPPRTFWCRAA